MVIVSGLATSKLAAPSDALLGETSANVLPITVLSGNVEFVMASESGLINATLNATWLSETPSGTSRTASPFGKASTPPEARMVLSTKLPGSGVPVAIAVGDGDGVGPTTTCVGVGVGATTVGVTRDGVGVTNDGVGVGTTGVAVAPGTGVRVGVGDAPGTSVAVAAAVGAAVGTSVGVGVGVLTLGAGVGDPGASTCMAHRLKLVVDTFICPTNPAGAGGDPDWYTDETVVQVFDTVSNLRTISLEKSLPTLESTCGVTEKYRSAGAAKVIFCGDEFTSTTISNEATVT